MTRKPQRSAQPRVHETGPSDVSPRAYAWDVLNAVEQRGAYSNVLLPATLGKTSLDVRDRAFVTDLVYTTLRWRGLLDDVISRCAQRSCADIDEKSLTVLRIGAAQALILNVPVHASVSTAVDLVAEIGAPGARGFVNAVMRKVCARTFVEWQESCVVDGDDLALLAKRWSHPRWIVTALRDALVADERPVADLPELLGADNEGPRPTLAARPGLIERDDLLAHTTGVTGRWSEWAVTNVSGDLGRLPAIVEGRAGVQDEGSQVVALVAAGVPVEGSDESWLDMCAGPGGKAALLAGLAQGRGAQLTAVEQHKHRAQLVASAVASYPDVRVVIADSTHLSEEPWYRDGGVDRVVLDAPCSGIGSLRRRPDLRWQRMAKDVADLAPLQESLLVSAIKAVRVGGVVTYATCSPHISETTVVVDRARAAARAQGIATELISLKGLLREIPGLSNAEELSQMMTSGPYLRLWPHLHGTDAMFTAVLKRV